MRLSIIIPVYNVAAWLPETVDSVLTQTYRDFELILVDDGSTDGSSEICDQYAIQDNRVCVIHQTNAGVSAARNAGVAAAKGDYIGFTDSDDLIERDMYAVMMELAAKHNADVVQCQHDRTNSFNADIRSDTVEIMDGATFVRRIFTKREAEYTNQVALWSKVYRRELFEGIMFPVGQVYEDEQETYKICLRADVLVETPNVLYHYIVRENSIITGISARKMLDKQVALLDRMLYLPQQLPDLEELCCVSFLHYSEGILCKMYHAGEKNAMKKGIAILQSRQKQLRPYMNRYEMIYIPMLKIARKWILSNDFAPIQKMVLGLRRQR